MRLPRLKRRNRLTTLACYIFSARLRLLSAVSSYLAAQRDGSERRTDWERPEQMTRGNLRSRESERPSLKRRAILSTDSGASVSLAGFHAPATRQAFTGNQRKGFLSPDGLIVRGRW